MPRMPKGLFHREGRGYYARKWINGKDRWIALGKDFEDASRKLRELNRSGSVLATRATVNELAREWLASRVAVKRTPDGLQKATSRVQLYLSPFFGLKLVGKVAREDLWEFRRWLETHERDRPDFGLAYPLGREVLLPVVRGCGQAGSLAVPARANAEAPRAAAEEARARRDRVTDADRGAVRVRRPARSRDRAPLGRADARSGERRGPERRPSRQSDEVTEGQAYSATAPDAGRGSPADRAAGAVLGTGQLRANGAAALGRRAVPCPHAAAHVRLRLG